LQTTLHRGPRRNGPISRAEGAIVTELSQARQSSSFSFFARYMIDHEPGRDINDLKRAGALVPEELDVVFISGKSVESDETAATAQHREGAEETVWALEGQHADRLLAGADCRRPPDCFQCRSPEFNAKKIDTYKRRGNRLLQMDYRSIARRNRRTAGSDQDQQSAETSAHGRLPHNVGLIADEQLRNDTLPDNTAGIGNCDAQLGCIMSPPIVGAAFFR